MADHDGIDNLRPALISVGLIAAAALLAALVIRLTAPADDFADDHRVNQGWPTWMQCAAETIERHPGRFTTGGFEFRYVDEATVDVIGTRTTTRLYRPDTSVVYDGPGNVLTLDLDCPSIPDG